MLPDEWIDYSALTHRCKRRDEDEKWCGGGHELRVYPVADGFVVAVCCDTCRDRGLPTRYSTETPSFPTFDQADRSRKALLRIKANA